MSHLIGFEALNGPSQGPYPLQGPHQPPVFYMTPSNINSSQIKYDPPPPYHEVELGPETVRESFLTDLCDTLKPFERCLCLTCAVGVSALTITSVLFYLTMMSI